MDLTPIRSDDQSSDVLTGTIVRSLPDTAQWSGIAHAWINSYRSEGTRDGYTREVRRWTKHCDAFGVDPLHANRVLVEDYRALCEDAGEADRTIARRLAAIASVYRYAASLGRINANPVDHVKRPDIDDTQSKTVGLDMEEAQRFLTAAESMAPRTHALTTFLLCGGMRVSEALSTNAEHIGVDSGHRFIRILGKGRKRRRVPITPLMQNGIDRVLEGRTEGIILRTSGGNRWDRSEAWREIRRVADKAKIEASDQISPHSLRHTAATLMLADGVPLARVQAQLGHADPRTTQAYNRKFGELKGAAGYRLDTLLSGG